MVKIYSIAGITEPISCWTHLTGALVFLILSGFLVRRAKNNLTHSIAAAFFGFSCVFVLSMSGVYHLLPIGGAARDVLQRLDHAAIYVMIAATITAVHAVLFHGIWRWGVIAAAWAVAICAIIFKTIYFTSFPEGLGLLSYLVFGWLGAASGLLLYRKHGFAFTKPLFLGAIAYTGGALLEFYLKPVIITGVIGPHEVFHLAVLLGISYHWQFIHSSLVLADSYYRAPYSTQRVVDPLPTSGVRHTS